MLPTEEPSEEELVSNAASDKEEDGDEGSGSDWNGSDDEGKESDE